MNKQEAYQQIRFINEVIHDRKQKNQATFFSIKLESGGKQTPLVERENGDTFYDTILQYLTKYEVNAFIIELYHGKAHNIKEPFQRFTIPVKKSIEVNLGYADLERFETKAQELKVTPSESVVSSERHYSSLFDREKQLLFIEFELKKLQSENDLLKKKCKKRKHYIIQLEDELAKSEKAKKHGLGNVTMGNVASNAIERFVKSDLGLGIMKNVFGASQDTLNGLLGVDENTEQSTKKPVQRLP
jgi:hypothetical protein